MSTGEEPRSAQRPWVTIAVAVSTALVTGTVSVVNTEIRTRATDKRSDAGYEVTKKAFELLQAQQLEHAKQEQSIVDHVKQLESRPAAPTRDRRVPRTLAPISVAPAQRKIEFTPSLDDIVEAIKNGQGDSVGVHEVYEGPPDKAPQWTKDADRAASAETK